MDCNAWQTLINDSAVVIVLIVAAIAGLFAARMYIAFHERRR